MRAFQKSFLPKARNNAGSHAPSINKAVVYIVSRWNPTVPASRSCLRWNAHFKIAFSERASLLGHLPEIPRKAHKKFRRDFATRVVCKLKIPALPRRARRGCSRFRDNGENIVRKGENISWLPRRRHSGVTPRQTSSLQMRRDRYFICTRVHRNMHLLLRFNTANRTSNPLFRRASSLRTAVKLSYLCATCLESAINREKYVS